MIAMLLAAGRGERMGPLTADLPKPLLSLGPETLIERHLRRLADAGFREIVINLSYRGGQIRSAIGETTPWGQTVAYSEEGEPPLETAGGIVHALPLLGDGPFLVVSTDVVTDHDFLALRTLGADFGCAAGRVAETVADRAPNPVADCVADRASDPVADRVADRASDPVADRAAGEFPPDRKPGAGVSGHLVLVPNPPHHPHGDFALTSDGRLQMPERKGGAREGMAHAPESSRQTPGGSPDTAPPRYTFSGIAVLRTSLFQGLAPGIRPLRDVLRPAVRRGELSGEVYDGLWRDVGTPERLAEVRGLMEARRVDAAGGPAR